MKIIRAPTVQRRDIPLQGGSLGESHDEIREKNTVLFMHTILKHVMHSTPGSGNSVACVSDLRKYLDCDTYMKNSHLECTIWR